MEHKMLLVCAVLFVQPAEFGMTHNVPFNKVANTVEVKFQLDVQNMAAAVAQDQR